MFRFHRVTHPAAAPEEQTQQDIPHPPNACQYTSMYTNPQHIPKAFSFFILEKSTFGNPQHFTTNYQKRLPLESFSKDVTRGLKQAAPFVNKAILTTKDRCYRFVQRTATQCVIAFWSSLQHLHCSF